MKKKYLLILLLVIILLVGIIVFYFLQNKKISEETPSGVVKINNPATDKNFDNFDGTFYYNKSKDYFFSYDKKLNLFSIIIISPDIQTTRDAAEKEFIKILGINTGDACKLNVDLRPIGNIISLFKLKDINYGLSFCSNSISFPK